MTALFQISAEGNLCFIIKVNGTLFVAFAVSEMDGVLFPIDIGEQNAGAFADAASSGEKEVDQGFFPHVFAMPAQILKVQR